MVDIESSCGYAAVLLDVVGSRTRSDRRRLQEELDVGLTRVNERHPALDPLTATVGDEIQGTYRSVMEAIRAVLELRLELLETVDIRAGIGWGDIVLHDPSRSPFGQDGSAWWNARAALDRVAASSARSGYDARMGIDLGGGVAYDAANAPLDHDDRGVLPPAAPFAVDIGTLLASHLALWDRAIATIDATEARIVLGDLRGESADDLAAVLGITPSAISQRRGRNHLRELVVALAGWTP